MLLTETNIPDAVFYCNRLGYYVVLSKATVTASGGAQGGRGGGIVSQENPEVWIFESTRFHGLNMVICERVAGNQ